ncbi:MAG: hypothetical protein ISQ15_09920 [Ilumatobacteraceae bacterium]|nr:hypothetical protein [Ilumatobacteraceae bacterium]
MIAITDIVCGGWVVFDGRKLHGFYNLVDCYSVGVHVEQNKQAANGPKVDGTELVVYYILAAFKAGRARKSSPFKRLITFPKMPQEYQVILNGLAIAVAPLLQDTSVDRAWKALQGAVLAWLQRHSPYEKGVGAVTSEQIDLYSKSVAKLLAKLRDGGNPYRQGLLWSEIESGGSSAGASNAGSAGGGASGDDGMRSFVYHECPLPRREQLGEEA